MFNNSSYFQKKYEESKTKRSREDTCEKTNKLNRHFNLFCKNINPSLKRELGIPDDCETEIC